MAKKGIGGKIFGWVFLIGFLVLVTTGFWLPLVQHRYFDKSYHFSEVDIDAQVVYSGDVYFTERRTFDFRNGPFTYADYTIDDPLDRVRDFSVSEIVDGKEVPLDASGYHSIVDNDFESHFTYLRPAEDEQRTFVFRYRYACAVQVFSDVAQFFWQFVGTGWDVPTEQVHVNVGLPYAPASVGIRQPKKCDPDHRVYSGMDPTAPTDFPMSENVYRAWGHGPLNGSISKPSPGEVAFDVSNLPANSYVEGRIIFPSYFVSSAGKIDQVKYPEIVEIERRLAADANALRAKHDEQRQNVNLLLIGVPVALVLLVLLSRTRDRVPGVPRILTEPPEPDSVEAAFVWAQFVGSSVTPANVYRTQLLRLVSIGAVDIQAEGTVTDPEDIKLIKKKDEAELTDPADRDFLTLLFGASSDADALDEVSVEHPRRPGPGDVKAHLRYTKWMEGGKKNVGRALKAIEHGDARFESVATGAVTIGAALYGIYTATMGVGGGVGWWLVPECIVLGIVALRLIPARVAPPLRERIAKLMAFRRYLKKFSSLPDAPAMAVIVWEKYMEWATALGVAKQVEKQIRALIPAEQLRSPWVNSRVSGIAAISMWSSLNASTPSLVTKSSATYSSSGSTSGGFGSSSSSSGGGGGFSGGGGGGGGGTGGGAG